jgi:hypothetical protein
MICRKFTIDRTTDFIHKRCEFQIDLKKNEIIFYKKNESKIKIIISLTI